MKCSTLIARQILWNANSVWNWFPEAVREQGKRWHQEGDQRTVSNLPLGGEPPFLYSPFPPNLFILIVRRQVGSAFTDLMTILVDFLLCANWCIGYLIKKKVAPFSQLKFYLWEKLIWKFDFIESDVLNHLDICFKSRLKPNSSVVLLTSGLCVSFLDTVY